MNPCICERHKKKPYRKLTLNLLNCWQNETSKRPYNTLILSGKSFEKIYYRHMDSNDYQVLLDFLQQRTLENFELIYMELPIELNFDRFCNYVRNLSLLSLCHVKLPLEFLRILSKLSSECKFKILRLNGNEFSDDHAEYLREFLINNESVEYLDVGHCSLDHKRLAIIGDGIINCKNVQAIDVSKVINNNEMQIADETKIAQLIAQLIWRKSLYEIHMKHCYLSGPDTIFIAEYLAYPKNITYLDLGSNNIGACGTEHIFKALKQNPQLIGLDISCNQIGDHGGELVAHYLPYTHLRYLDIGRNKISAKIISLILLTIKKNYPIRIFNIVDNEFDCETGKILERQLNAKVLLLHSIDVRTTYDDDRKGFCIVPQYNEMAEYNFRYHRITPFYRKYDLFTENLCWHDIDNTNHKLLVNGLFIGPIYVDRNYIVMHNNGAGDKINKEMISKKDEHKKI